MEDDTFDKILQSDISADAENCCDRIHHRIMPLVFLALCVGRGPIVLMLQLIQLMNFFLHTGWGELARSIGGNMAQILHGLCQGNVPALVG